MQRMHVSSVLKGLKEPREHLLIGFAQMNIRLKSQGLLPLGDPPTLKSLWYLRKKVSRELS